MQKSVRQLPLVLAACSSLAFALLGQEPSTVRLRYELPVDAMQRALAADPTTSTEQAIARTIDSLRLRCEGLATVQRLDGTTFAVDLAHGDAAAVAEVRAVVERIGNLSMRIAADASTRDADGKPRFDLPHERELLERWLADGGRAKLAADPSAIAEFHGNPPKGSAVGTTLQWCVHRVLPDPQDPTRWQRPLAADAAVNALRELTASLPCIAAFREDDYADGKVPAAFAELPPERRFLVELFAVDLAEEHFTNGDLDPTSLHVAATPDGHAVDYALRPERRAAYGDWSGKHIGLATPMLLDGEVVIAPRLASSIPGTGRISGDFRRESAEALRRTLLASPLTCKPTLLAQEPR